MAYSGGRDSTALLHATLAESARHGIHVLALHVHHGLSPNADAWLAHCEAQCARWSRRGRLVEFFGHRLTTAPPPGDSIEAWARQARYQALCTMARERGAEVVLLGHHRQDQAETWLLQALRGAGTAGLAGMPKRIERDGIGWLRPWLERPRSSIDAYVRRHRLKHIDDDSNADPRFARNRLRAQVWPALVAAFPEAESAFATASRWAHEADAALAELAALDLSRVALPAGLSHEAWQSLSPARRSNALRAWLKQQLGAGAPAALAARLLDELPGASTGRWDIGGREFRLYRGVLRCAASAPKRASSLVPQSAVLSVREAGLYPLPEWAGLLEVDEVETGGVPMAWLAHMDLRERVGAERFQAGLGRPPRSLKKQFQEAGVPAWERDGPLVYSGGQLVFVPGLGLDARVIGLPGQPLARLRWWPDPPLPNGRSEGRLPVRRS